MTNFFKKNISQKIDPSLSSTADSTPINEVVVSEILYLLQNYLPKFEFALNHICGIINVINDKITPSVIYPQRTVDNPAVPISESVTDDYIICLEDGKKMQILKRHLWTKYGMSLEDYKNKWDLPHNYPMVALNYTKKRSKMAKAIGLGRKKGKTKGIQKKK